LAAISCFASIPVSFNGLNFCEAIKDFARAKIDGVQQPGALAPFYSFSTATPPPREFGSREKFFRVTG